jgi:hypothetical protein
MCCHLLVSKELQLSGVLKCFDAFFVIINDGHPFPARMLAKSTYVDETSKSGRAILLCPVFAGISWAGNVHLRLCGGHDEVLSALHFCLARSLSLFVDSTPSNREPPHNTTFTQQSVRSLRSLISQRRVKELTVESQTSQTTSRNAE